MGLFESNGGVFGGAQLGLRRHGGVSPPTVTTLWRQCSDNAGPNNDSLE